MTTVTYVPLLTDTGLIRKFPDSNNLGSPMQSAANVVGHFSLLVLAVSTILFTTITSMLGSDSLLASGPVIFGAWTLMGFVGAGVVKTSYRFVGYGLIYLAGLAIAMAAGGYFLDDATFFGGVYLGVTSMLGLVVWVLWYDAKGRGLYDA